MVFATPRITLAVTKVNRISAHSHPHLPLPTQLSHRLIGPGLVHQRPISVRAAQAQTLYRSGALRGSAQRKLGLEFT